MTMVAYRRPHRINLRAYASQRWNSMSEREQEDQLNDRKRPKIGVTAFETVSAELWCLI